MLVAATQPDHDGYHDDDAATLLLQALSNSGTRCRPGPGKRGTRRSGSVPTARQHLDVAWCVSP
ncbi:hypothetical protein ACFQ3Z_45790 [Streptomyces nogalater]